jgi:hypothetical protein
MLNLHKKVKKLLGKLEECSAKHIDSCTKGLIVVVASFLMSWGVVYLNTWSHAALVKWQLVLYPMVVAAVIIGPFIEEGFKRIALLGKFPILYTVIFALLELHLYMSGGHSLADRLSVCAVHLVLIWVQICFHKKSLKMNNRWVSWCGFGLAYMMHAGYNLLMVVS